MSTLYLYRGLPGSGKTTAAELWVGGFPERRSRVNRDDIRRMLYGAGYSKPEHEKEKVVTRIEQDTVRTLLAAGKDVAVDDMNLRAAFVKEWFNFSDDVQFVDFETPVETCVFRDAQRQAAGVRYVGADVIRDIAQRFMPKGKLPPIPERPTGLGKVFRPYVKNGKRARAIICDIDGTLAYIRPGGRSPYDGDRVKEDGVHEHIRDLVNMVWTKYSIVITSGRDEKYRAVTEQWLRDNSVMYDALFMRPEGDNRKDDIVKDELFEQHIAPYYDVDFVLDDRDRVVNMWRAKGIPCLQVAPGAF
jgi:predicted kinase